MVPVIGNIQLGGILKVIRNYLILLGFFSGVLFVAQVQAQLRLQGDADYSEGAKAFPPYNDYQAKTTRKIPVFIAEPK